MKKLFILLFGFTSITSFSQTQTEMSCSKGVDIQLLLEQQSYLESAYHRLGLVDIEKNAGFCFAYKFDFLQEFLCKKNLIINYAVGYKWVKQEFMYSNLIFSDFDYWQMGFSQIKSGYFCFSFGLSYKKLSTKRTYLKPRIGIGSNFLVNKEEKLTPYKNSFSLILDPYSTFKSIVPEVSIDFLLFHTISNSDYRLFFGLGLKNSPKYYQEDVGELAAPVSISLRLGISKIK